MKRPKENRIHLLCVRIINYYIEQLSENATRDDLDRIYTSTDVSLFHFCYFTDASCHYDMLASRLNHIISSFMF